MAPSGGIIFVLGGYLLVLLLLGLWGSRDSKNLAGYCRYVYLASLNIPKRCIMIKILRPKKTDSSLIKVLLNKTLCSHVSTVIYLVCFLLLEQNLVAKY